MTIADWHMYLLIGLILLGLEAFAPTFFLFPLGGAALGTALVAPYLSFTWELVIFSLIATLLYFVSFKFIRPQFRKKRYLTGSDSLIGQTALALADIDENNKGYIKIYADEWTALPSRQGGFIPKGTKVIVDRVSGNKVYVSRVED
ncbi:MAG: NfeD family protein [Bdellovibrionaceae bacterium]|nr:NfeD family protein [Pseudobdellovibrionaceae bacterium]